VVSPYRIKTFTLSEPPSLDSSYLSFADVVAPAS
jgi:hypothetical protein